MATALLVMLVALVGLLFADHREVRPLRALFKTIASTAFVAASIAAGALDHGPFGHALLAAFVLSWLGDVALIGDGPRMFQAGLGLFLLGHVGFGAAFAVRGLDAMWLGCAAVVMVVQGIFVARWVLPHAGRMRTPVGVYIAVICGMTTLAWGAVGAGASPAFGFAAVAFYLSDICVARERFVVPGFANKVLGLPLYYGAQALFVLALSMER